MSKVENNNSNYIMFLDDDDVLIHENVLSIINDHLDENSILTWKFLRPDRLIYKENLNTPLILGEIDTSNVCFCSSIKNDSQWHDKQYGDFNYFKPLFDTTHIESKYFFDYALTGTQFNDRIGNFGENI